MVIAKYLVLLPLLTRGSKQLLQLLLYSSAARSPITRPLRFHLILRKQLDFQHCWRFFSSQPEMCNRSKWLFRDRGGWLPCCDVISFCAAVGRFRVEHLTNRVKETEATVSK